MAANRLGNIQGHISGSNGISQAAYVGNLAQGHAAVQYICPLPQKSLCRTLRMTRTHVK
uniref:Uncharacterized protein n=1 Tax=Melanopsichium pennsylvanicum 4 TaxID=1398559 RepID=A0A077R7D8_9BASI|nr:uncharacterized protein BN887_03669 [Melanopsichium pennsylvanicum 4]